MRDAKAVDAALQSAAGNDGLSGAILANGARCPVCPLYEAKEADFRRIAEVDIFDTFRVMQSATRLMAERGGCGNVILLTSAS